ncbi:MAG: hypothetical protein KKF46_00470 [Nanoarchaeota archaeon]|nr:hypothetical protein [Nanoarchaeota archaeon]MBU1320808.1 hypothetical protein [Nanoarchaeota archaeon]MBU1596817.1 hypothetical protein [Nanoarchaeota archaeon]MBU2440886.1 hypothetical protein [Nanoarchaeota archaeon]
MRQTNYSLEELFFKLYFPDAEDPRCLIMNEIGVILAYEKNKEAEYILRRFLKKDYTESEIISELTQLNPCGDCAGVIHEHQKMDLQEMAKRDKFYAYCSLILAKDNLDEKTLAMLKEFENDPDNKELLDKAKSVMPVSH